MTGKGSDNGGVDLEALVKQSGVNLPEGFYVAEHNAGKKTTTTHHEKLHDALENYVGQIRAMMDTKSVYTKPTLVAVNADNDMPRSV